MPNVSLEPVRTHVARVAGALVLGAAAFLSACTPPEVVTPPKTTQLNGSVYGRTFERDTTAAVAETADNGVRTLVIRVARRTDTCAAAQDPSDNLDPSLIITVTPDETGTFPITGVGARQASATLYTFTNAPDGGFSPDAGASPVVRFAEGGQVEVTDYEPGVDGKLNANVVLQFPGGEGYVGQVGARGCERVR